VGTIEIFLKRDGTRQGLPCGIGEQPKDTRQGDGFREGLNPSYGLPDMIPSAAKAGKTAAIR
jgi:hypothetical protein